MKVRLDEGLLVSLSPSSTSSSDHQCEFDSTGSSLREAIAEGALENIYDVDEGEKNDTCPERACPAKYTNYKEDDERACPAKYTNYKEDDERACPAKYNGDERACLAKYNKDKRACPAKYEI